MATADYGDFFITGDEWGLVEVVPAENREHYAEVARQFAEYHKDTEFSPHGWATPPFVIPSPEVPLTVRAIRPETLTKAFANILVPTHRVTSCVDYTGPPEPAPGFLAWMVPGEDAFVPGFYGRLDGEILSELWWSPHPVERSIATQLAEALTQLGARYQLLLAVGGRGVIDFADHETMMKYLTFL